MPAAPRNRIFAALVYLAFFASGAASLMAEVTWNRMLIVVVGNSLQAAAMIIMVFMGGLGLGSWTAGRLLAKRRVSLLPYFGLELAIGLYVLASPALFAALKGMFMGLAADSGGGSGLGLVRMGVSMLALLPPAFLMGATFPAMVAGASLDAPTPGSARTGYLYSINTLGAALGCFAAGYYMLLELGVAVTLKAAFGAYLVAAVSGMIANLLRDRSVPAEVAAGDEAAAPADGRRFLMAATLAVGFVALAYEVLLTRISILYLGNTISVFPLVLTAFLLGTGFSAIAGTWLYGLWQRRGRAADALFTGAAAVAGVLLLATPYMLLTDAVIGADRHAKYSNQFAQNPLPILGVLLLPVVFLGALLPLAIRMLAPSGRGKAAREAATLYALNTAGVLLGAGIVNHTLVPAIGLQKTLALLAGLLLLVAAGNAARRRASAAIRGGILAAAVAAALVAAFVLPNLTTL
ncbi:MAG TPA: fused MFS/spermidine synthase, partial [Candidatus Krumholzibacteria bacterium]|nr:fused MFS/spermidine synthase [Candidatus Krumholzibacteria bacterium]